MSFITGAITMWVAWGVFSFPPEYGKYALMGYIPVGLGWSLIRWKRHSSKVVEGLKDFNDRSNAELNRAVDSLTVSENVGKILGWTVNWPWSVIDNVFGDIIDFLKRIITVHLRTFYDSITAKDREKVISYRKNPPK